jgi:UDPglucose 6-dehydrogenase
MNITIVGSGYVGLVAGACFADTGNDVLCVDSNEQKIERLRKGEVPIYEPGLSDIIHRNVREKRLSFTTSLEEGVTRSEVIFIAVGTPQDEDGSADLTHVLEVAKGIGRFMNGPKVVVDKSTVPVGTARKVYEAITSMTKHHVDVVSNPEFLKEGAAIEDFMKPDRVVIGVDSPRAAEVMKQLYAPFVRTNNPILVMDVPSAEMTKYAANAMLATRISFMNEISQLCERVGADIDSVRIGIGTDSRIGMSFLFPGIGYGGSCFPKDVQALIRTGDDVGVSLTLAKAVEEVNRNQKQVMVRKLMQHFGAAALKNAHIAIWGLAFKPKTDDVREAPALVICKALLEAGASLSLFDPEARETFAHALGTHPKVRYAQTNYEALEGADALVICTEWNEFRRPNYGRIKELLRQPIIFDGRNILDRAALTEHGITYYCIGRPEIHTLK